MTIYVYYFFMAAILIATPLICRQMWKDAMRDKKDRDLKIEAMKAKISAATSLMDCQLTSKSGKRKIRSTKIIL